MLASASLLPLTPALSLRERGMLALASLFAFTPEPVSIALRGEAFSDADADCPLSSERGRTSLTGTTLVSGG